MPRQLSVPLEVRSSAADMRSTEIFRVQCPGWDCGEEAAVWFSTYLTRKKAQVPHAKSAVVGADADARAAAGGGVAGEGAGADADSEGAGADADSEGADGGGGGGAPKYRLVRVAEPIDRRMDYKYGASYLATEHVRFHDACQLLVVNTRSVSAIAAAVNLAAAAKHTRRRRGSRATGARTAVSQAPTTSATSLLRGFRPSVVVDGGVAWAEDLWGDCRVLPAPAGGDGAASEGGVRLRAVRPCGRCVQCTIDQDAGKPRPGLLTEPLATLQRLRLAADPIGGPLFGQYFNAPEASREPPVLRLGSRLVVKSRRGSSCALAKDIIAHYRDGRQ